METAERIQALASFQSRNPSKTLPAQVIANGTGANSRAVFVDRGSNAGVMRGMAVITADGIVGKVTASYPTASQVLLITDPTFAAGVISQKHRVRGTVRGQGQANCLVDYIQNEEKVDPGEQFFTSGDDGVFPRGLPVGMVTVVRLGNPYKQVYLVPAGLQGGLAEVLIITEGAHQPLPDLKQASTDVHIQPPPPDEPGVQQAPAGQPVSANTEADRLRERYKAIGDAQGHTFGTGLPGSRPPNFNLKPGEAPAPRTQAAKPAAGGQPPPAAPAKPTPGPATPSPAKPETPPPGSTAGPAKPPELPAGPAPQP
jgi:rod shape-determining protein MreC